MSPVEAPHDVTASPVFVSYARKDEPLARQVVTVLEEAGYHVWWDEMIRAGDGFSDRIAESLEQACAVVVLWSQTSVASNWVRDEAQIGARRGRLVPVSLDGTPPPLGYGQFHTIGLNGRPDQAMQSIVAAVAAVAGLPNGVAGPTRRRAMSRRSLLIGSSGILAAGGAAAWWLSREHDGAASATPSIAVLPFDNIGGEPTKAYFAEGVAAEIRAALTRMPQLRVAANQSSNVAREGHDDARTIARKLNVSYLLDGNVRRAGDRVRVAAELIDGRTGFTSWSDTFDRPAADVFAVQDEIAGVVVAALTERISAAPSSRPAVSQTGNLQAYDAFLRGRSLYEQAGGEETDRAALAAFDEAIAADPGYAGAYAARSRALTVIANQYAQGPARRALYEQAIVAARKAVALRPNMGTSQSALGFALFYGHIDPHGAEAPFQRSAILGAGDADVLSRYALFLTRTGRFDLARAALVRAVSLDPLNARIQWLRSELEVDARRYSDAIPLAEGALGMNSKMSAAHATIGAARLLLGDLPAAEKAYRLEPNGLFGLTGLAIVLKKAGHDREAAAKLAELTDMHGDNALYQLGQIEAQWGDATAAFEALDKARATSDAGLTHLKTDPLLDPIRTDVRFSVLQRALGLL